MIRAWSPEARFALGFIAAPLAVPLIYALPFLLLMFGPTSDSREWGLPLIVLGVGLAVTYLNSLVVIAPLWIILGRSRLVRSHWPLTVGGSLSGAATTVLFANRWTMTSLLFGAAAGFATALLFWVIALREGTGLAK